MARLFLIVALLSPCPCQWHGIFGSDAAVSQHVCNDRHTAEAEWDLSDHSSPHSETAHCHCCEGFDDMAIVVTPSARPLDWCALTQHCVTQFLVCDAVTTLTPHDCEPPDPTRWMVVPLRL